MNTLTRNVTKFLINVPSICPVFNRSMAQGKKRFYKNVSISGNDGNFEINLDNRKLKTPNGQVFQVPNEALALAVANEWAAAKEKIIPCWMHLTALSFTVSENPNHLTKWDVVNKTLEYLETDTLLYRDDSCDELIKAHEDHWDPILNWFNQRFDVKLETSSGICGTSIPPEYQSVIQKYLLSHNIWSVSGFWYGVEVLKSVILTIAAVERKISIENAVALSRLEVDYQSSRWGSVVWAHDVDKYDIQTRFAAAVLFTHLNSCEYGYKKKAII